MRTADTTESSSDDDETGPVSNVVLSQRVRQKVHVAEEKLAKEQQEADEAAQQLEQSHRDLLEAGAAAAKEAADVDKAKRELVLARESGDLDEIRRCEAALQKEQDEADRAAEKRARKAEAKQIAEENAAREAAEAEMAKEHEAYLKRVADRAQEREHLSQDHYVDKYGNILKEHLFWTFACVLAPANIEDIPQEIDADVRKLSFPDWVVYMCETFYKAGLEIQVVARTETSKHKVVLLLRLPERRFRLEYRKLALQRWKTTGQGMEFVKKHTSGGADPNSVGHGAGLMRGLEEKMHWTEADRIQVTAMLLNMPTARGGCGLHNIEHFQEESHDPRVCAVFPLHNYEWVDDVRQRWSGKYGCCGAVRRLYHRVVSDIETVGQEAIHVASDVASDVVDVATGAADYVATGAVDAVTHPQQLHVHRVNKHHHHHKHADDEKARNEVVAKRMKRDFGIDEPILTEIRNQYGVRFAFLFTFMQLCEQCIISLAMPLCFGITLVSIAADWSVYLRVLGVAGILVPALWAPWFLGRWDSLATELGVHWKTVGVKEDVLPNPYYREGADYRCKRFAWAVLLAAMLMLIFIISVFILEWETLITCTPMCGSWFHETIWRDFVVSDDVDRNGGLTIFAPFFTFALPSCFPGPEEIPFPVDGHPPHRGFASTGLGLIEGVLIGGVYSELFGMVADNFASCRNDPDWRVYERTKINFIYPFEVASSMFYWLIMAFVFIPFSLWMQGSFFATASRIPLSGPVVSFETAAPCFTMDDGVCDEWTGLCALGTDALDCAGYGCMDPNAVNFDENATRAVQDQFVTGSLFDQAVPFELRCLYRESVPVGTTSVAAGGADATVHTQCRTPNNQICDEPLSCMQKAMAVSDGGYAVPVYERCLDSMLMESPTGTICAVGSDVDDCTAKTWEIMGDCAGNGSCSDGLMSLLESRHVPGNSLLTTCEALLDPHGENPAQASHCASLTGFTWPVISGNSCNGDVEAEFATEVRCKTTAALNCTTTCDACAGCLLGESVNMAGRCESYGLCVTCQESCAEYSHCFSQAVIDRASTAGQSVCERMGLVNNGWCDEDVAAANRCTAVQTLIDDGVDRGLCRSGEDSADCGTHPCNFGCQPTCEDRCQMIFPDAGSADACACAFGCALARGEPASPLYPRNVTGGECTAQCEQHCHEDTSDCTCGCGRDRQCCTTVGGDKGRCFKPDELETPCKTGCNLEIDTNYDPRAKVHWQPACANTSSVFAKTSDMVRLWMYDRRFNLQLDALLPAPIVLSMALPMIFEILLPFLCLSWQRSNRRPGQRSHRRKLHSDDVEAKRCCCVRVMNCFMCDDDQGVSARAAKDALPETTDEELAHRLKLCFMQIADYQFRNSGGIPSNGQQTARSQAAIEQKEADQARAVRAGQVRTEPWRTQASGDQRHSSLEAADAIIVESQASELEIEVELVKLCLYILNVQMFTIVFVYLPAVVWFFLVLRLRDDLWRLTHLCKRHVPMYPTSDDPLGGLQWWLTSQTWACVIIVGMFWVSSTGCMEAWVELFAPESCSVVNPPNATRWKFPECSFDFESDVEGYSEVADQVDEGWPIGTPIPQEVMSINRASYGHTLVCGALRPLLSNNAALIQSPWSHKTLPTVYCMPTCLLEFSSPAVHGLAGTCWQERLPALPPCPFHAGTSEFVDGNFITYEQGIRRAGVFFLVEHLALCVMFYMFRRNQDHDGNSDSKNATEQHRLAQHWLIADQLYPQLETDNTFNFAVAHRFGSKWMRKAHVQAHDLTKAVENRDELQP